jgi:UDP-2,3-diacylglucosamine pyrophosphatase LpxH
MPESANTARRIIVISDLHIGGEQPSMMSSADRLAGFIETLPSRARPDESLELVIAGDVIDFLAEAPFTSWTADPGEARRKLRRVMNDPAFARVFAALNKLVAAGHALTILIGNHDLELALPSVQDALLEGLGAAARRVHFVDDGRAYRIGRMLIEHGNRYDGANENDWTNLRIIASAQSRGEYPPVELRASAGSWVVEKVVSPLKARYPFVDLLQPQGELVALLLAAFEPGLILDLPKLARVLNAQRLEARNAQGRQPGRTHAVAARAAPVRADAELQRAFGDAYAAVRRPPEDVALSDVLLAAWNARHDGFAELLDRGEDIPAERLEQIRVAMKKLLLDDASARPDGDTEQYGAAARRLIEAGAGEVELVVMGHTHLARHVGPPQRASYINSGTWADVVRVPAEVLRPDAGVALQDFLRELRRSGMRSCPATFADVRIEASGAVSSAALATAGKP